MHIFSHLYLHNASFDFDAVIGPVPLEFCADTAEAMEGHVAMLLEKFTCNNGGSGVAEAGGSDGSGGDSDVEDEPVAPEAGGADDGGGSDGPSS